MKKNYNLLKLCTIFGLLLMNLVNAQIIADGTYKILSTVHNEVMTCETNAPHDALMAVPNQSDNFQLWTFTHQGSNVYKITNVGNGLTLGINDGWCGVFGDAKANFGINDQNVEFSVTSTPIEDKYVIQIAFTTCNFGSVNDPIKAFDIQDGAIGGQIQTFDTDVNNPNQQFEIVLPETLSVSSFTNADKYIVFYDSDSFLNIKNNEDWDEKVTTTMYDITGKIVKTNQHTRIDSNLISLNISDLNKGLYFIQIEENNSKSVKKVIVY
jgi:hypothetical protein